MHTITFSLEILLDNGVNYLQISMAIQQYMLQLHIQNATSVKKIQQDIVAAASFEVVCEYMVDILNTHLNRS